MVTAHYERKIVVICGTVNVQQCRRCTEEACETVLVVCEQADDKSDAVLLNVYELSAGRAGTVQILFYSGAVIFCSPVVKP
jgi:hypothetical protein